MSARISQAFSYTAGGLLIVTAMAKLIASGSNSKILETPDPLLSIPYRYLFLIIGGVELIVSLICFFEKQTRLQSSLVAWLATNLLLYRIGVAWIGYEKPCSCLGNLTDALHISTQTADNIMKIILAFLLIGSYAISFWLWRQRKIASAPTSAR